MSRRRIAVALIALLVGGVQLFVAPAPASAAALTGVTWNVSNGLPSATAVRYTWTLRTATTATLSQIRFTVPTGTAGAALTVADVYGVPAGGSASLAGTTVTYSLSAATSVAAGVQILVSLDGFTNTATSGTYTSNVTTYNTVPAAVDGPTASTSNAITGGSTAGVTIVPVRSTSFTDNLASFTFPMDPLVAADRTQAETLTVTTNAANGYALSIRATTLGDAFGNSIAGVTAGVATGVASGSFTANRWGYTATATGSGVLQGALTTAGNYVGYTTGGESFVVSPTPATGDTINLTHRVKINFAQDAGLYTSTITYTVVPSF